MKYEINASIIKAFKKQGKNHNYALNFLLNSVDPATCRDTISLVKAIEFSGDTISTEIDENVVRAIQKTFGAADTSLVEQLLWVTLFFPEI